MPFLSTHESHKWEHVHNDLHDFDENEVKWSYETQKQ